MGRVVVTHSTYIDGLIPILKDLAKCNEVKTVTPGTFQKVKGKSEKLIIRLTTEIRGGYRLIARKGKIAQEVFVHTALSKQALHKKLEQIIRNP